MSLTETRSGGNAPGLSAGSLNRRSALRGSAAAAIAIVAGVTTARSAGAAPDAALIDLARRLESLMTAEDEAWDRHASASDAADQASPPAPIRREVKGAYTDLDGLSREERSARLMADPVDHLRDSAAADAEHNVAVVEHARAVAAIEKRHGVARLAREARRASEKVAAASEELAEMAAASTAGLAAKARVLLALSSDPLSRPAEMERHAALLDSLLEDTARLGTGRLA